MRTFTLAYHCDRQGQRHEAVAPLFVPEGDCPNQRTINTLFALYRDTGATINYRILRPDGSVFWRGKQTAADLTTPEDWVRDDPEGEAWRRPDLAEVAA